MIHPTNKMFKFYPSKKVKVVIEINHNRLKSLDNLRIFFIESAGDIQWLNKKDSFSCSLYAQVDGIVGKDVDKDIFPDVGGQRPEPIKPQALFVLMYNCTKGQTNFFTLKSFFQVEGIASEL